VQYTDYTAFNPTVSH